MTKLIYDHIKNNKLLLLFTKSYKERENKHKLKTGYLEI